MLANSGSALSIGSSGTVLVCVFPVVAVVAVPVTVVAGRAVIAEAVVAEAVVVVTAAVVAGRVVVAAVVAAAVVGAVVVAAALVVGAGVAVGVSPQAANNIPSVSRMTTEKFSDNFRRIFSP